MNLSGEKLLQMEGKTMSLEKMVKILQKFEADQDTNQNIYGKSNLNKFMATACEICSKSQLQ